MPRLVALLLLAVTMAATMLAPQAAAENPWGRDYFPNVALTTQDNRTVRFYDDVLRGKIVVINFIFTRCGDVCPLDTAQLKKVQQLLGDRVGKDIFMYSISVDPENDTPEAMREFMTKYEIGPGWTFLRGSIADVTLIQKKLGLNPAGENPRAHSTSIVLGNEKTGQWVKRSPYENPQMLANLLGGHLDPDGLHGSGSKRSYAEAVSVPMQDQGGEQLFRTRCAACHSIGGGEGLGPDLLMMTSRRSMDWLARWIKEPDVMLAEKDPVAMMQLAQYRNLAMPNLKLSDANIDAVMAFIDGESQKVMEQRAAAEHAGHGAGHHH